MKMLCLLFMLFPVVAYAGEDCSQMGGKCKEVCSLDEEAVKGAFLDCSDKQECCIPKEIPKGEDVKKNESRRDPQKPQRGE